MLLGDRLQTGFFPRYPYAVVFIIIHKNLLYFYPIRPSQRSVSEPDAPRAPSWQHISGWNSWWQLFRYCLGRHNFRSQHKSPINTHSAFVQHQPPVRAAKQHPSYRDAISIFYLSPKFDLIFLYFSGNFLVFPRLVFHFLFRWLMLGPGGGGWRRWRDAIQGLRGDVQNKISIN